jgi:hypothetical protein
VIAINLNAIRFSTKKLEALRGKVKATGDAIFRKKLYAMAEMAVMVSPQFSGDFVSNWNFAVNGNMPVYRPGGRAPDMVPFDKEDGGTGYRLNVKQAGDREFAMQALHRMGLQLRWVTLESKVHLVNATDLEIGAGGDTMTSPYDTVDLRAVNIIPGNVRIGQYIKTHIKGIQPKDISA